MISIKHPTVFEYLEISVGHLPTGERAAMDGLDWPIYPYEYGWWVHVPHWHDRDEMEMASALTPVLYDIVLWGSFNGMTTIRFDRDGEIYDELEFYDEEDDDADSNEPS